MMNVSLTSYYLYLNI